MLSHPYLTRIRQSDLIARVGRVRRISATAIEADGPSLPLGALCRIQADAPGAGLLAEVVSVDQTGVVLAPFEHGASVSLGARVCATADFDRVPVGDAFLGRVVDGLAQPLDGGGPIQALHFEKLARPAPAPLKRTTSPNALETGVRAIDGLITLGQGQRVGIFAASGVGKTSLVTQLAQCVTADRIVICLVGERGREVEDFWRQGLQREAKARATLIAATSDQSAAKRVRAAHFALALADHWRSEGRHVFFVLDSITRLAMALREIGLAAGEPPTVRAYTPSVFAALPQIVERCGAFDKAGAITAIMTVLCETDDADDPLAEFMKSLLDGHIVLSRNLAEQGQFPAIDAPRSISRLADAVTPGEQRAYAREALSLLSVYESSRTLIETGVYARGADAMIDRALARRAALTDFLKQSPRERSSFNDTWRALKGALGDAPEHAPKADAPR
jgi:flagellum-specific ATP synthase